VFSTTPYVGLCHRLQTWLLSCIAIGGMIGNTIAVIGQSLFLKLFIIYNNFHFSFKAVAAS
jgi:hypothetical protein